MEKLLFMIIHNFIICYIVNGLIKHLSTVQLIANENLNEQISFIYKLLYLISLQLLLLHLKVFSHKNLYLNNYNILN